MTTIFDDIANARHNLKNAENELRAKAKTAINIEVERLLTSPNINKVAWAQKASEYNDEGMYPGVFGPVFNLNIFDDDNSRYKSVNYDDRDVYDFLYGMGQTSSGGENLKKLLNDIGEDILSDIFGDECVVEATLVDGKVTYESEYAGV